ncbi:polyamine-modulated factor 1-binding protein 1-like [Hydractinia symbiolongicarpus]|uniref:polyamine-modulated factor 1-binding protein 1-like n=1 Tax=Hydractinia symbiolongicarpus TaxID=13093 RepID=UPI002550B986|nr:polyamine-modulated factor 1-binding protein 1-like [Hydractinia symbiolongicarpus]
MENDIDLRMLQRERKKYKRLQNQEKPLNHHEFPQVFIKALQENSSIPDVTVAAESPDSHMEVQSDSEIEGKYICIKCRQQQQQDKQMTFDKMTMGDVSHSVLAVALQLNETKEQRRQQKRKSEINEIMERVTAALERSGLGSEDKDALYVGKFDVDGERRKRKDRECIFGGFSKYENSNEHKTALIQEMADWMDLTARELESLFKFVEKLGYHVPSDEHFDRTNQAFIKSAETIDRLVELLQRRKQNALLRKPRKTKARKVPSNESDIESVGKSDIDSKASSESMSSDSGKIIGKRMFNEKELADQKNLEQAIKTVKTVFDLGIRSGASSEVRRHLKLGLKQFKELSSILKWFSENAREIEIKTKQLFAEKNNMKMLEQKQKEDNHLISKLTKENQELGNELVSLREDIKKLERSKVEISPSKKSNTHVPTLLPPEEKIDRIPSISKNHTASASNLSIHAAGSGSVESIFSIKSSAAGSQNVLDNDFVSDNSQETLNITTESSFQNSQLRKEIELLQKQLNEALDNIQRRDDKIQHLSKKTADVENEVKNTKGNVTGGQESKLQDIKVTQLETQLLKLQEEFVEKNKELIEKRKAMENLEERLQHMMEENRGLKEEAFEKPKLSFHLKDMPRDQLISRMKAQSEKELQKLRKYIIKEQHRFQANLRKTQIEHGRYVDALHNEKVQMLRALKNFKHVITHLIHQEDLEVDEEAEGRIESYRKCIDENRTTSETVMETLMSIENNLNKALLQKRLLVKHANSFKVSSERSAEQYRLRLQRATDACKENEKIAQHAIKRTKTLTTQYDILKDNNNTLQKEIAPCKELLQKYQCLQKEMERLNVEKKDITQETKDMMKQFQLDRNRLKQELNKLNLAQIRQMDKVTHPWKGSTCNEKIILLNEAFESNRISADVQEASTEILNQANKLSNQYFAAMVRQYTSIKRQKKIVSAIRSMHYKSDSDEKFKRYIAGAEARYQRIQLQWQKRKQKLKSEKEEMLLNCMNLLREHFHGDLAVVPFSLLKNKTQRIHSDEKSTAVLNAIKARKTETVGNVIGQALTNENSNTSYWKMPPDATQQYIKMHTPKIVELDVNSWRRSLKAQLTKRQTHLPSIATLYP